MSFTDSNLSIDFQDFLQRLQSLDLGPIAYKLIYSTEGTRLNKTEAAKAINHYLMFLVLVYLYPNLHLVPSQEVDRVWHNHIADTVKYAQDTQMLFGRFIHHFPYSGHCGKIDRRNQKLAFMETKRLLKKHFRLDICNQDICQIAADCQPLGEPIDLVRPNTELELLAINKLVHN